MTCLFILAIYYCKHPDTRTNTLPPHTSLRIGHTFALTDAEPEVQNNVFARIKFSSAKEKQKPKFPTRSSVIETKLKDCAQTKEGHDEQKKKEQKEKALVSP